MEKRYQIFISSTFADLEEERKGVMEAIIELDCFPAGMEMFPASDMEQFDYIKSIIDESDYYVIIVAGKYGSVAEDGISYTEKEFEYAKEKGIPILAFVKGNIDSLPASKVEVDKERRNKLNSFRNKVLSGRLAKFWDTGLELKCNLQTSLSREMRMNPRTGWIKADSPIDVQAYKDIEKLKSENSELQMHIEELSAQNDLMQMNRAKIEDNDIKAKLSSVFQIKIEGPNGYRNQIDSNISEILKVAGYRLLINSADSSELGDIIAQFYDNTENAVVNQSDLQQIILKMLALGIIEATYYDYQESIEITEYGKTIILSMVEF